MAAEQTEGEPLLITHGEYPLPARETVERAEGILAHARRPMILAGHGVVRRRAAPQLRELAAATGIPVANTFMSKGVMGYSNPLARLTVGLQNRDYELCGLAEADVLLAVGYDLVELAPRLWNPRRDKRVIHVDTLPAEVDEYYQPELEIVSEISDALVALKDVCRANRRLEQVSPLRETVFAELEAHASDSAMPMKPQRILNDMRRVLATEDLVISDVGAHKLWVARLFPAERPNSIIISNGFAAMGIGVPGGVAAKLAEPHRRVVVVTGDGGFLMNAQELETAKRLGTAFVTIVWVDGSYGVIRWKQERSFGRAFGVDFGNPDFAALAKAFELPGFNITRADDFALCLEQALRLDQPSIIAVPVDYRENHRLIETLGDLQMSI